jgi:tetratricopeptide (TPR) repeat protein
LTQTGRLERLLSEAKDAFRSADYVRAETLLEQAVESGASGYADVHHMLGLIYHTWGQYAKARAAFEEALRINPRYTEAALNLAITYNDLGRYAEAQELFARVRPSPEERIDPFARGKIANLHQTVGEAYRSHGLAREAIAEYEKALGLCPDFVDVRMNLAHALAEAGDLEDAIRETRDVLARRPGFVPALLHLGLFLHRAGDHEGAKSAFSEVLTHSPEHERAAMYLRMLEVEQRSE